MTIVALAVGAAVVGFIVGTSANDASSPALDKHASTGGVRVSFPSTWHRAHPPRTRDGLSGELALAPGRSPGPILVIGRGDESDPSLLPQPLRAALGGAPAAQIVTLGSLRFYRYRNLRARGAGGAESVYVLPTTSGPVVGACLTGTTSPDGCERVLATIKLASGTVLPVAPSLSYARRLNAILGPLGAASADIGTRLREAEDAAAQRHLSERLAGTYGRAAAAIRKLDAGEASSANRALADAFTGVSRAYSALARAAGGYDARADRSARTNLATAQRAVYAAFTELRNLGYRSS